MDVTIHVVTGGGKKANRKSASYTAKEVQTVAQVVEVLNTEFKDFFGKNRTLDELTEETKPPKKEKR